MQRVHYSEDHLTFASLVRDFAAKEVVPHIADWEHEGRIPREIFARAGGGAMHLKFPMQRFWRDAHVGLSHAIHVPGSIFHASALTQLGGEPQGVHRSMI